jgi:hypothetical protein
MTDLLNKEHFDALVGRLDTLMEEAAALNAEIAAAMRGEQEHPFWPDRRRSRQHYQPDRRQTSERASHSQDSPALSSLSEAQTITLEQTIKGETVTFQWCCRACNHAWPVRREGA